MFRTNFDGTIGLAPNSDFLTKFVQSNGFTLDINNDNKQSSIIFGESDISQITTGDPITIKNSWHDDDVVPSWTFKTDRKTFNGIDYDDEVEIHFNP